MKAIRLPFCQSGFTLRGLNLERFMNVLKKEGVPLVYARRADRKTLLCRCYTADVRRIALIAGEKGWRMTEITPLFLSAFFRRMRERPGFLAGALLAAALAVVASGFVWRVEVQNAGPYRAEVAAYLALEGFAPGLPKARVDAAALEKKLARRYPDVAWFHVYVQNMALVVDCTLGVPMPALPAAVPGDIVAARDGVVESLRVFAGTPLVKAGDAVRAGQILIRGEERGRDESLVPVAARGVVTARGWETAVVRTPLYDIESAETGKTVTKTQLCAPGFRWPAQMEPPPFLACNLYVSARPVVGAFFPCYQSVWEWREVSMEYALADGEARKREAAKAALDKLKKALYGNEIIDKWIDYCMIEDGMVSVSVTAEWLADIGQAIR